MAGFESKNIGIFINMSPQQVYAFISVPENFPKWASGLCKSIQKTQAGWIAETPTGPMAVRFTEKNPYGVLDHYIQSESGTEIYIPMRVIANDDGSELIFTLVRLPDMSDEKFQEDAEWVAKDLKAIKNLLEGMPTAEYS